MQDRINQVDETSSIARPDHTVGSITSNQTLAMSGLAPDCCRDAAVPRSVEKCQEETFNTLREPLSHSRASRKFQPTATSRAMRRAPIGTRCVRLSDADLDHKLAAQARAERCVGTARSGPMRCSALSPTRRASHERAPGRMRAAVDADPYTNLPSAI